jgi:hypothetical protein
MIAGTTHVVSTKRKIVCALDGGIVHVPRVDLYGVVTISTV